MTHRSLPFGLLGKKDAVQSGFSTDSLTPFVAPLTPNGILRLVLSRTRDIVPSLWFPWTPFVSHLSFFGLLGKKEVVVPAW